MKISNLKFHRSYINIVLITSILILVSLFAINSNPVQAGNNKIRVENRQQEIVFNPIGNNEFQGNMMISWQAEGNHGDEDVEITIGNLEHQNSNKTIDNEAVLIKEVDNQQTGKLNSEVVLSTDTSESKQIKFKLDKDEMDLDDLQAGTYAANINFKPNNIEIQPPVNSNHGHPKLIVKVTQTPEIDLNKNTIDWTIEKPNKDEAQYSESVEWEILNTSNYDNLNITFSSEGINNDNKRDLTKDKYKRFFQYIITENDNENTITFDPGNEITLSADSNQIGNLKLKYSNDIDDGNWTDLGAGEYEDVVTITISN
mgnify:CR=1 FL=1